MGGLIAPSNVIGGNVNAPLPSFLSSPLSGLFSAPGSNALGLALSSNIAAYQSLTQYQVGVRTTATGILTAASGTPTADSTGPVRSCFDPTGRWLFTTHSGTPGVSVFSVNPVTGAIAAVAGSPFALGGTSPASCVCSPDGKYLYVGDSTANINVLGINAATGVPTAIGGSPFATTKTNVDIAISADGKFLYSVDNGNPAFVSSYSLAAGVPTALANSPLSIGQATAAQGIVLDPYNGTFLYVAQSGAAGVIAFSRNSTTGVLALLGQQPVAANPSGNLTISPNGQSLYLPVAGSLVAAYTINRQSGALTLISTYAAAGNLYSAICDPFGAVLYIVGATNGYSYTIAANGALTATAGNPYALGVTTATIGASLDQWGKFLACPGSTTVNIGMFKTSAVFGLPLIEGSFDPTGLGNNIASINGSLYVNGAAVGVAGQIKGTATNDNAAAGNVGEFLTNGLTGVAAVNNNYTTITSLALTPGDWEVWGDVGYVPAATTNMTYLSACISSATGAYIVLPGSGSTQQGLAAQYFGAAGVVYTANPLQLQTTRNRVSIAAPTTIYFITLNTFTVSTLWAYGALYARRMR